MYAWIEGRLDHTQPTYVVLSAHGVGYMLAIPLRLFANLPAIGTTLRLYTSFQIRENHQALYGFATDQERRCFDTLLHVTGIGPKVALSILGHLTLDALYTALYHEDLPTLCAIPGIGKKSAQRLLIEMKDRCQEQLSTIAEGLPGAHIHTKSNPIARDACNALIHLGYSLSQAEQAVQAVLKRVEVNASSDTPMPLSTLITHALKAI